MLEDDGPAITVKVRRALAKHLNTEHHRADLMSLARGLAGLNWAEHARIVLVDANGITLEVEGANQRETHRFEFGQTAGGVLAFRRLAGSLIERGRSLELGDVAHVKVD